MQTGQALFLGGLALAAFLNGEKGFLTLLFSLSAVLPLIAVPFTWKQYQAVRAGAVLFAKPAPSVQIPAFVSIFALCVLTVLVLAVGWMSYFLGFAVFTAPLVRLTILVVNLLLWLLALFLWYRLFTARPEAHIVALTHSATEGVWPPPPTVPQTNPEREEGT